MTVLPATFAAKTVESTCLIWVGATNSKGYGLISVEGRIELAHRVAYEAEHGPLPEGLVVDHVCRVRNCVRGARLEAVTQAESRGRASASLAPDDVCINGHGIATEDDLYRRPSGATECQACRRAGNHKHRPTTQLRAERVRADIARADATDAPTARRAS